MHTEEIRKSIEELLSRFSSRYDDPEFYHLLQELLFAFYHSQDGIYVVDPDGTTLRVNPAFEELTGIEAGQVLRRKVQDLVREGYFNTSVAVEVIETGQSKTIIQEYHNGKLALVTGNAIYDRQGRLTKIISNIRDITELQSLYDTLSAKERLLEDYSAKMMEQDLQRTHGIIARSEEMKRTVGLARRVAGVDSNVLLLGESGVGKGLVAKLIARMGGRRDKPFVTVNCGAIPEQLMESELFGYEKGAFTGANREGKAGLVEAADSGVLFLDEIGEIPLSLQPKLLLFLENKEVTKIGASKAKEVDVRVIAATNRDLKAMVRQGQFREDLYYRLDVVSIQIPPLRERKADILSLCQSFLEYYNTKNGTAKTISPEIMNYLLEYDWPGNVRQLRNLLERLVVMSAGREIVMEDLPREYFGYKDTPAQGHQAAEQPLLPVSLGEEVKRLEQRYIKAAMAQGRSIRGAAKLLGISPSGLYRRLQAAGDSN